MYRSLEDYVRILEQNGELLRIHPSVQSELEIAEITDRQSKLPDGGKALLFENSDKGFAVLTNMFGSVRRMSLALGVDDLNAPAKKIEELFEMMTTPRPSLISKVRALPSLVKMAGWMPSTKKGRGVCQQVVHRDGDLLDLLPALKCWPADGGRFITLPMVTTVSPKSGIRNIGMYRMQIFDNCTAGLHWHIHKTGARHYQEYKELNRRMPVSICLGGDPVYTYSATAPLPDGIDEWLLSGFLRGRSVKLVRCITNDLYVPEDCDIVIEGYVDPAEEKRIEGPFGDHTGFYSLEDLYPVLHVTAVTHRHNAIYPATLVGIPPQEDARIAEATERLFIAPLKKSMLPEMRDMYLPEAGVAHNFAIIDIKQEYQAQALKTAALLWGAGQMMFNKFMIITAADGDIRNLGFLQKIIAQADFSKDLLFSRGVLDVLDHAASQAGCGGKLALDATAVSYEGCDLPQETWKGTLREYLLDKWRVELMNDGSGENLDLLTKRLSCSQRTKIIIVVDQEYEPTSAYELLWLCGANCDPARDVMVVDGLLVVDIRIKSGGINGFDRRWPNPTVMDKATIDLVDSRWEEYGIGEMIPSPSAIYGRLMCGTGAAVEE